MKNGDWMLWQAIPVAVRPQAEVCSRLTAGSAGSNSPGGISSLMFTALVAASATSWSLAQRTTGCVYVCVCVCMCVCVCVCVCVCGCLLVCDIEGSKKRAAWAQFGLLRHSGKNAMKGMVADYLKYPPRHSPVEPEENSSACPTVHRLVELTIPTCDQVTTKFTCCNCSETKSTSVLQDTKSHTGLH